MSRRRSANMIRRFGEPFWLKSRDVNGELTPFNGYFRPGHKELLATSPLAVGDIAHPIGEPLRQYLITESRPGSWYDVYSIAKIEHHGQLYRFSEDGAKDAFGRAATPQAAMIYSDVPLVLLPSISDRDQNSQDRTATATEYIFLTQDIFEILPKDRLTVSGLNLVIQSIQLSAAGLRQFTATATQ